MTTDNPEHPNGPRRRVTMRRGRGVGFSGGNMVRTESLRTSAEADEVDDIIDPDQMNEAVRARALAPIPQMPPMGQGAGVDAHDTTGDPGNPRDRLNQVSLAGSQNYGREYRLNLIHRMLMRNVPLDQIARELQVSVSTIEKDRAALRKRLRESAKELDINEIVGAQTEFYDELRGMSLRIASQGQTPVPMKLAAMRTSLAANADKNRFYTAAGVYDVLRFRRAEDGTNLSDVQLLMARTQEMLAELNEPEPEPEEQTAPSRTRRRRRPGGFDAQTFDDPTASSGDNEIVDL